MRQIKPTRVKEKIAMCPTEVIPMRVKIVRFLATSAAALVFLSASAGVALGQVATGTVTGTITDAKGAAMAGATVIVHNEGTGADTPEKSNDSGVYVAPLLQPGTYDITASQMGFATVQNKGVAVQVGGTVRIDITMPVASQQSLITVTTEAPVLETEKTEQSQNVSENLVSNLPVSSRRWEQFVMLTPGVTPDGSSGGIAFHGINSLYSGNSVDGANNNSSYNGTARGGATSDGYTYSGDSIREFQVSGSSFTAEVGQSAGGAVNAVTKSGTNSLHGDLFYNMRNPIFNALDPVGAANARINNQTPTKPVHQQNQFGGSTGGPLLRDKLFFFVTYDGYRKIFPNIVTTRQVSPSIDSLTCPTVTAAGLIAAATAPTAAQCAAAKNFALTQVVGNFPRSLRQDIEFLKLDYQLNSSNHINVTGNIRDWKNPSAGLGNAAPGTTTSFLMNRFVIANWTMLIGSNKVNEVRYQWGVDNAWSALPGYSGPQVALTNLFTYGAANVPQYVNETRHQISDNFSWTKGTHSFKFGVDINLLTNPTRGSNQSAGTYTYSSAVALGGNIGCVAPTGFSSAQTANTILCDWLMDLYGKDAKDGKLGQHWAKFNQILDSRGVAVGSTPFAPGFAPPAGLVPPNTFVNQFSMSDYAGYFQDTWKMRPNLTVNLGLRYDLELPPPPQYGNTLTPLLAKFTNAVPPDYGGIQPRVGVAWNFTKKTVLRAGGGFFVAKTPGNLYKAFVSANDGAQINCNPGTGAGTCVAAAGLAAFNFPDVLLAQQDFPASRPFTDPTLGAAGQPRNPLQQFPARSICPCGIRGIDPTSRRPRAYEAQVAIERQLPGTMSLSASYVFTRGIHLPSTVDANIVNRGLTKSYDVVDASGATTVVSTVPFYGNTGTTTDGRVDSLAGPIISQFTGVNSRYSGMILSLHKPMSHGVEILANYTLSKATDDGQAGLNNGGESFFATDGVIDPFNRKLEQGYSQTDARNRFTSSVVWQPTYGKGAASRMVRGLASGWNLSTTITASTGTRYSALVSSTTSQTTCLVATSPCPAASAVTGLEGGMSGADIATGGNSIGGRAAWLPHNTFIMPSYTDVDFRVARQFTIHERYAFEIRAEAFNLFNSTIVQAVSQNAYTFTAPAVSTTATPTPACWSGTTTSGTGPAAGTASHSNTCMTPVTGFKDATTTTANLLGSRQLQFGFRFSF